MPVFVADNPSRDCFIPISEEGIRRELGKLPRDDWKEITQTLFRRFKKSEYEANEILLAEFLPNFPVDQVCA